MRDTLAERLLATVMKWGASDVARERPDLQALASYKYDDYQQYSPGMRFVESLALWLEQFDDEKERAAAYAFVRDRLVFISSAEVAHFVGIAYPDFMRPVLASLVAERSSISGSQITSILSGPAFRVLRRQTLFLGLSDGAHTDLFRRSNNIEISHEQVWGMYELPNEKAAELRDTLGKDLQKILGRPVSNDEKRFKVICLLDDFSGSGLSYLRTEDGGRSFKGKLNKIFQSIDSGTLRSLVDPSDLQICLLLYIATAEAKEHIERVACDVLNGGAIRFSVQVVQLLADAVRIGPESDDPFAELLRRHYDPALMDEHLEKGGKDIVYGFHNGGLPLVLGHNTPNNSVYLLWATNSPRVRPLFPRATRHRAEQ